MSREELLRALRGLAVEAGSLACLGCGHEHNCSLHGCAVIGAAVEALTPPPNDPLTLEELREMDGDVVWVVQPGHKSQRALVNAWWKTAGIIRLTFNNGVQPLAETMMMSGAKIYRRRPEASGGEAAPVLSRPENGPQEEAHDNSL